MKKPDHRDLRDTSPQPSRAAQLHALLFTGAALGTTLLTLGVTIEPKLPPYRGE
jgi:hypothetical protein